MVRINYNASFLFVYFTRRLSRDVESKMQMDC
jgi:hypothetical protein